MSATPQQGRTLGRPRPGLELDGTWQAAVADEDRRRVWLSGASQGWQELTVPGHWRSHPAFDAEDGPLLYRRSFDGPVLEEAAPHDRWWLTLDGVFYQGDVWLDEVYLGDTEGYFFPHSFEVTDQLRTRRDHVLGVEVTCTPPADLTAKRAITGVFQHWDCPDPDRNPGGIWRPVGLHGTGPVALRNLRVLCTEATAERAAVRFDAELDTRVATSATLQSTVGATQHSQIQPLAAGANHVTWTVSVDQPELWWPWALGDQPLVDVTVDVLVPADPDDVSSPLTLSDHRQLTTGLRSVSVRNWIWTVNGERLFVKGANQGPTRLALGDATPAELERDVQLAVDTGLDLLRLHAHVSRPELYEAADRAGLLLWQDFPLQWGYHRSVRAQAVRQASKAVDLLGHHPSVALWCAHNEPIRMAPPPGGGADTRTVVAFVRAQALPSWNRSVLDRAVKSALRRADPSRPVVAHSGSVPHPPQLDGTDSHLYFGWYHGEESMLGGFARALPRMVRFVSEFGAQAVPDPADFCDAERWPELDWAELGRRYGLQRRQFERYVPPGRYPTFAAWRDATQAYQATLLRRHVETLRKLKYRPTGGFAMFCFADGTPGVSWSVLDHLRAPKAGWHALREACRPVIVVAERLPPHVHPGDALALDVHVVSDLRAELRDVRVTARLSWGGRSAAESAAWTWEGDIAADACVRVGTVATVIGEVSGEVHLDLELSGDGVSASNHDTTTCRAG